MSNIIKQFLKDEEGATAIEYGLIAGLIAVAILVVVGDIGTELNRLFGQIKDALFAAGTQPTP
ncbi:MAG: Flp family type IVb pilin [Ottowia sp.]|uniref:Flp family type IVb pilin n=1 Tax=Ottowia sp. TaxID=1898956 RepID=UPI003C75A1BF